MKQDQDRPALAPGADGRLGAAEGDGAPSPLQHVVVMGVAGCGKTTLGARLAGALGWAFAEGDSDHPASNIAKMAAGQPLTDADRKPWLERLAARVADEEREGRSSVIACSALKRTYRDILRSGAPRVRFVHLHGAPEVLLRRIAARPGHFFPPELLASQLATLEPLGGDEDGMVIDVAASEDDQLREALRCLHLGD